MDKTEAITHINKVIKLYRHCEFYEMSIITNENNDNIFKIVMGDSNYFISIDKIDSIEIYSSQSVNIKILNSGYIYINSRIPHIDIQV